MAEKNMPAMPWFVKDYLIDTMHLTTEQHGAYMLLLGNAWNQGGSLPDNDQHLSSIARLSLEAWLEAKPVIMEFWILRSGRWSQKRLSKELAYVTGRREALRAAGKKGGNARHGKQTEKEESQAKASPQASPEQGHKPGSSNKDSIAQAPTPTLTPKKEREESSTTNYQTLHQEPERADEPEPGGRFFEGEGVEPGEDEDTGSGDDIPPAKPRERWATLGDDLLSMTGLADKPRPVSTSLVRQWIADWTEDDIRAAVSDAVERDSYDPAAIGNLKYFEPAIRRRVETRNAEQGSAAAAFWADFPEAAAIRFVGQWRAGEFEWEPDKHGPAPNQPGFMGPKHLAGPRDRLRAVSEMPSIPDFLRRKAAQPTEAA